MKKFTPYVFPVIALLIVVFLLFRWYSDRTDTVTKPVEFGEGVEIENLSENELSSVLKGSSDVATVEMSAAAQESSETPESATGVIRYDIQEDKVLFSVLAQVPELDEGMYQVWLKQIDGEGMKKAFTLEMGKGGMMGSAALSTELLPFEVVVSKEMNANDDTVESVLLKGVIEKPVDASASPTPVATPEAE